MDRATMQTVCNVIDDYADDSHHPIAISTCQTLKNILTELEEKHMEQMAADHKEEWKVVQLDHSCPTGVHSDLLDCNC